nr:MAG TPA: hypothetical protein [Bacteriophage sp.]
MREFVDYAYYGNVVGKSVKQVRQIYKIYCKLFNVEEVDNVESRICNEYDLFIEKGVFTK